MQTGIKYAICNNAAECADTLLVMEILSECLYVDYL